VFAPPRRRIHEVPADAAGVPLADYAGYPELARASALPVGAELFRLLEAVDSHALDEGGQIRLAQQWARVEAASAGRKIAAVAAMAGPPPTVEELARDRGKPDFTDYEVGAALRLGGTSAQRFTVAARALAGKMTGALAALAAGRLSYLQALQYVDAAESLTVEQCARAQELTLDRAPSRTPYELRQLLRRTVVRVGAEDFARAHNVQKKHVGVSVFYGDNKDGIDGMADLSAHLTALDAAIIDHALDAWVRATKARGDTRSRDELRAAALVDLAERYLMAPNGPRAHGRPVTVSLAIDLPTFLGLTDHPGEILGTGAMIPADALRDLIPHAALRRIITDPLTGELLDYGRTSYRFPADATAFVIARWVTSTGPGSTVPAANVDIDHGQPWQQGGVTRPANGNPCNRRWHRAKTIGGWTVAQRDNTWVWTSPLGLHYETSPHDYRLGP
jgi:hypothetical protein